MKKLILLTLSALLLLSSCSLERTGNFKIYLTDQPVQADEIWVTITEIKVQKNDEGFIILWQGEEKYDLLQLQNVEKKILDIGLEQGTYTQIRLVVNSGEIVIGGESHDLTIPSREVKIPVVFTVTEDGVTEIVLDFEADHSINVVQAGQTNNYILRPVIIVKEIRY
ncbi:MAG: DUF4382 domain-containing protein [bacterium]